MSHIYISILGVETYTRIVKELRWDLQFHLGLGLAGYGSMWDAADKIQLDHYIPPPMFLSILYSRWSAAHSVASSTV